MHKGLKTFVLATVIDMMHNEYIDSIIGGIVAPLFDGPVYFNYYPNFSVYTFDETIDHILQLQIQTTGFNMKKKSKIVLPPRTKVVSDTLIPFGWPSTIRLAETPSQV